MERTLYEGECHGGPLDGERITARFPKGFLAVDRVNDRAWVYRYMDTEFFCADEGSKPFDEARAEDTAEGSDYDVVAVT